MRKSFFLPLFLGLALLVAAVSTATAEGKTVTIPKGTKVQKVGPGNFKLTTPDGLVFTLTNYKKAGQVIGDCGISDSKGRLIATGTNAVLKGGVGPGKALKDIPASDYVKIDDEVTWLPAIIQFPTIRIFNRLALEKLSPQPDPPGKLR